MKFKPLHDRVVLRRLEGEEKTKGGIIIPDTALVPAADFGLSQDAEPGCLTMRLGGMREQASF